MAAAILGVVTCAPTEIRAAAARQDEAPAAGAQISSIRVGFAGKYKVGYWTPVWVTVVAGDTAVSGSLELTTPDGDGVPARFVDAAAPSVQVTAHQTQTVLRYVKFGQLRGDLTVRWVDENDREREVTRRTFAAAELPAPSSSTDELIVALGPALGLEEAVKKRWRSQTRRVETCHIDRADALPRDWYGYEAVNLVVVTTSEVSPLEQLDEQQFAALERWLRLGGRLVLCAGSRGGEVFAPGNRLARFAPGSEPTVVALRQTTGLENFAGATERLDEVGGEKVRRFSVSMTGFAKVRGWVENSEIGGQVGRIPTIIRYPHGFGQIVFVALDLDRPPFDRWQGRPGLVGRLLVDDSQTRRDEAETRRGTRQVTHFGYDDLAGQLRGALDQFSGVTRVEFSWIAGLVVAYLLLIGPGDYFLMKQLRHMHWTWLTFPLVVILLCVTAFVLAQRWRGSRLHVNQVDLVDIDVESDLARACTWTHLYSPSTQVFQLSLQTQWPVDPSRVIRAGQLFGWQGLPGHGLGGLDTTATAALFSQPYTICYRGERTDGAALEIRGLPIPVSGSKSLTARWWAELQLDEHPRLSTDDVGLLRGELANPLDVELSDSLVVYENWMYPIDGKWRPGQRMSFDDRKPRNLQWRLARRKVVETKDISTPWDRSSLDVPRILEVLMFYKAAGGESYTELTNRYQPYLDLSDQLRTGRAMILGRGPGPASDLQRDGQSLRADVDRQFTYYRVLLPVDKP
ncbi:MAG: hypothetical protein NTY19_36465 [Planctomycetota bacterium]|nr:hypothetical protein [Planctomycetota bacterium]